VAIAILDFVPPPFPFSLCMLAAGAARINRRQLFGTLALCRLMRFGVDVALGVMYGKRALSWLESAAVQRVVVVVLVLALVVSLVSAVRWMKIAHAGRGVRTAT
jgi:hypothetical protein